MRVRPRFELSSALTPDEIGARVAEELGSPQCRIRGLVMKGRIELTVHAEDQHLWSPQLTVDVAERDAESLLRARFGPHAHVWTMYVALYAAAGCLLVAALVGGSAQMMLDQSPWALWGVLASLLAGGLIWLLAFVGQGFGGDQMYSLRAFLEKTSEGVERSDD